jgi:hypothetical protein
LEILLGVVALVGLRPWATTSVAPDLSVWPGIDAAVGDSAVVAEAAPSASGTGGIAAPRSTPTVSAPAPAPVPTPERHAAQPLLAVSAGRALIAAAPSPVASPPAPEPAPSAEPVAATPAPAPEAAPASPPVVASVPSGAPGTSGGPVTSGVGGPEPEQSCEGDEYLITVTFEEVESEEIEGEESDHEEAEADIVVRKIGTDGSETEVKLRGDLSDVRSLVATLVAEGNCVDLEIGTTAEDGTPSGGTSPAVVPTEGVSPSAPAPRDQAAPNSP